MRVVGIDPGNHGAIAMVEDGACVWHYGFETVEGKTRGRDLLIQPMWAQFGWLQEACIAGAFIERVQAMPRQGASSGFKFGHSLGVVQAFCCAAGLPYEPAEPRVWMKEFGLHGGDDDQAIAIACRMFPRVPHLFTPVRGRLTKAAAAGIADAALIALWGYRRLSS